MPSVDVSPSAAESPAEITLALDAGGTALKGALLVNGRILPGSYITRPSESQGPAARTIAGFAAACHQLLSDFQTICRPLQEGDTVRIGFAFPGPFDYEEGIALLQGVGKYDALYQLSVPDLLRDAFRQLRSSNPEPGIKMLETADIRFGNDARMFGLGIGRMFPSERIICLTLGTGLGSAFVEHGSIVSGKDGVPASGMLFAEPFRGEMVDSYFGRRGMMNRAAEHGLVRSSHTDIRDLAEAAGKGDPGAQALFREYGMRLGEMLLPYVRAFRPDRIVLGGQISNSFALWEEELKLVLGPTSVPVLHLPDGMTSVFHGILTRFEETDGRTSASS